MESFQIHSVHAWSTSCGKHYFQLKQSWEAHQSIRVIYEMINWALRWYPEWNPTNLTLKKTTTIVGNILFWWKSTSCLIKNYCLTCDYQEGIIYWLWIFADMIYSQRRCDLHFIKNTILRTRNKLTLSATLFSKVTRMPSRASADAANQAEAIKHVYEIFTTLDLRSKVSLLFMSFQFRGYGPVFAREG